MPDIPTNYPWDNRDPRINPQPTEPKSIFDDGYHEIWKWIKDLRLENIDTLKKKVKEYEKIHQLSNNTIINISEENSRLAKLNAELIADKDRIKAHAELSNQTRHDLVRKLSESNKRLLELKAANRNLAQQLKDAINGKCEICQAPEGHNTGCPDEPKVSIEQVKADPPPATEPNEVESSPERTKYEVNTWYINNGIRPELPRNTIIEVCIQSNIQPPNDPFGVKLVKDAGLVNQFDFSKTRGYGSIKEWRIVSMPDFWNPESIHSFVVKTKNGEG